MSRKGRGNHQEKKIKDPLEAAVRSLKEEDLAKGVSREPSLECTRCRQRKTPAGSKSFGLILLCNDCVLAYARACFAEPDLNIGHFLERPANFEREIHFHEEEDDRTDSIGSREPGRRTGALEERISSLERAIDEIWDVLDVVRKNKPELFR